jgi:curved DNA-binding protein CbpA
MTVISFQLANPQEMECLKKYQDWGIVPQIPVKLPGLGRFGRFQFNQKQLLSRCGLSVAQRKEVIFLSQHFHKIDHFEFLNIETPSADQKELKKAYFAFSKSYHPDSVSMLDLGEFQSAVAQIFQYGKQVYDLFMGDQLFFETYASVVAKRDQLFLQSLEKDRHQIDPQQTPLSVQPIVGLKGVSVHKISSSHSGYSSNGISNEFGFKPQGGLPKIDTPIEPQADIDARKAKLRERLNQNLQNVKINVDSHVLQATKNVQQAQNTVMGSTQAQVVVATTQEARIEQAKDFFFEGNQSMQKQQWLRALNQFKLAMEYDPTNTKYKEHFESAKIKVNQEKSMQAWIKADEYIELGLLDRAYPIVQEALALYVDDQIALKFADIFKEFAFDEVTALLENRIQASPYQLQLYWTLGQLYLSKNKTTLARQQFEKMLTFDPSEPRALKILKKQGNP